MRAPARSVAPRLVLLGVTTPADWPAGSATTAVLEPAEMVAALESLR